MFQTKSSDLAANRGLSAIGSNAVPYLARALATTNTPFDRSAWVRHPYAQWLLTRVGDNPRWTKSSLETRRAASFVLLAFGFEARPALPELHAELLRPNAADRQTVVHCLAELGPLPESLPFLVQAWPLTTNEVWVVRHDLLHTLGTAGTNAAALAMPIALAALDDPEPDVRIVAANALDRWGQPAPASVPRLVSLLSETNLPLATAAAGALGQVTNRADVAVPALRRLLASTNGYTRAVAAITLWRLGGERDEARRILESLLTTKEAKGAAAAYLGRMGALARDAVPTLLRASHQDIGAWVDMYDRAQCAKAVLRIQGETPEALGVLEEALTFKSNGWVRANMAEQLGDSGPLAVPLIPALRRALQDSDREVRHAATEALGKLERLPD
jgi:tetratricopeptide (TPR) repeat protein